MKIGLYCQRQRCKHVELEQFWHAFASRGFVIDSWAFLYPTVFGMSALALSQLEMKFASQSHVKTSCYIRCFTADEYLMRDEPASLPRVLFVLQQRGTDKAESAESGHEQCDYVARWTAD